MQTYSDSYRLWFSDHCRSINLEPATSICDRLNVKMLVLKYYLGEALLDFTTVADLESWLSTVAIDR
jgi:hypothetical protein